jgi:transposase
VDTHADTHVAAALDPVGGLLGVREFPATAAGYAGLLGWLAGFGTVCLVGIEGTGSYGAGLARYVTAAGIRVVEVDRSDRQDRRRQGKSDKLDAVWLAKLAERGMLRASFIPSRPQRQLRDLTRYRRTLTQERTREKQRAEKLLEDAQIKLSAVISDIFGKSGRAMLDALVGGQRNPHALAALAYRNMRAKTSVLQEALTGHFTGHHAFMLGMMLARIDALTTQIDTLTTRIGEAIAPFAAQVAQLDEIPGIGITAAQDILAEIGTDMSRFPTPGHLVSWAKFAPTARQSAGRSKAATTGKGNPWLGGTLGEAATSAARTKTFLASRYKRIARRRGKQRALVAVGNSLLTIIWHLLSDPAARFTDLGPDWHDRLAPLRRKRQLIAELERLSGKKVTLNDAA